MSTVSLETSSFFPTADPQQAIKVAEDPSGKTLLVTATLESDAGALAPFIFDVSLPGFTAGGDPIMNVAQADALPVDLQLPVALAITPDQAPHAAFTENLARAGDTSTFDAANSTVMYGSINSYKWNFGDGTPTFTTTGDTTTHVFQAPGTYTVTLIEQDSEGTSIPPAFPGTPSSWVANGPGQTPYRLSSTLAETSQTVTITTTTHPTTSTTTTTTTKTNPKHGKKPFLSLEPTVGTPGTVVTVTGIHFPNNAIVTIEWSTTNAAATAVKVKVHNGGFVVQLLVLVPDLLGPRQAVALTYKKANRPGFLVVAGSDEPGGSDASPVFRSEGP
jgi:PKD repeat protein